MSIHVIIGSSEREINDIEPNWINEQINRRKNDGVPVCVKVYIKNESVNISLVTTDCPCGRNSGGRLPNHQEREIFELWNKLHLNDENFSSGNLIAFLKQVA